MNKEHEDTLSFIIGTYRHNRSTHDTLEVLCKELNKNITLSEFYNYLVRQVGENEAMGALKLAEPTRKDFLLVMVNSLLFQLMLHRN